jgi:hypothetical protein
MLMVAKAPTARGRGSLYDAVRSTTLSRIDAERVLQMPFWAQHVPASVGAAGAASAYEVVGGVGVGVPWGRVPRLVTERWT